jgi:hypothetical protein
VSDWLDMLACMQITNIPPNNSRSLLPLELK